MNAKFDDKTNYNIIVIYIVLIVGHRLIVFIGTFMNNGNYEPLQQHIRDSTSRYEQQQTVI